MSRFRVIKSAPAKAGVTSRGGKCDFVTVCSFLSGPEQRLKQPAIYANTDEILEDTLLNKRYRGTTSASIHGILTAQLKIDTTFYCLRSFVC